MPNKLYHSLSAPTGILGTFPSDPEVIGVFPELSATILPYAQEIRLRRGDDIDLRFQIQNDKDPPDPVNINGVVRWATKQGYGQGERAGIFIGNEGALLVKRSSSAEQIETLSTGRGIVHITRADTLRLPPVHALWDLEVTQIGAPIEIPGYAEVQLLANLDMITARHFTWPTVVPGDVLTIQGRKVLVIQRISPVHLRVDWSDWQTAVIQSADFSLARGKTKTVASGPLVIEGDVTV